MRNSTKHINEKTQIITLGKIQDVELCCRQDSYQITFTILKWVFNHLLSMTDVDFLQRKQNQAAQTVYLIYDI